MSLTRTENWKTTLLCVCILAGCSTELFDTPAEIRGVWNLEGHGRILLITESSLSVYTDAGGGCRLDYRQDYAGPRLSDWEAVLSADGQALRFREPGKDTLIEAYRLAEVPDRCMVRSREL